MKSIALFLFIQLSGILPAQNISISDEPDRSADSSAVLDVYSTSRGLLIPRMTITERDNILSPANSLLIFQTDSTPGFYYFGSSPLKSKWSQVLSENDACWKRNAQSGYTILANTSDYVGIGLSDPKTNLHINGDDGLIATGTFGLGNDLQINGQGTKMIWYPKKAAFRAGYTNTIEWDSLNMGNYSVAFGNSTLASGDNSTATGYMNIASGPYSYAGGQFNQATGSHSWAGGRFMQLIEGADHTFVWGYSEQFFPTLIPTANAFIIFPEEEGGFHGQVGIGTMFPTEHLDVTGTIKMGGFKMSGGAAPGMVLTSDNTGRGTWQSVPATGIDGNGNAGFLAKFTDTESIGNSGVFENDLGNIGIGTVNPTERLTVNGKLAMLDNLMTKLHWISSDGNNEGIYIDNNGRVGIGTNQPLYNLDVNGSGSFDSTMHVNGNLYANASLSMGDNIKMNGNWMSYDGDDKGVYIANNDYVGINTSTPTSELDVNGKLTMDGNISLNGNYLSRTGASQGLYISNTDYFGFGTNTPNEQVDINGKLYMRDNIRLNENWISGDGDDEGIYINSSGNVGIGYPNPLYKLEVYGNAKIKNGLTVKGIINADSGYIKLPDNITIISDGNTLEITSGLSKVTIDADGGISIESSQKVNIKTTDDISMEGKNIDIHATNNLNILANNDLLVKANNDLNCQALRNVNIDAALKLTAKGNVDFLIQGGITGKVICDNQLDLIGGITKINNGSIPCARLGDAVMTPNTFNGTITTGATSVFIGP